jgi:ubiquinone/menaquinone biosynthesis C-methylase UbiE
MLLVLAHGAILSGIVWIIARHGRARPGASADAAHCCQSHAHSVEGKVIRSPRFYDWLVRVLTLGGERKFRRWTLNLAELQPGEAVLDVGCGTGTLLIEAALRVGESGAARGIEPSSEMVAHARRKARAEGVTIGVQEGSADHLPFSDASFDVVFCTMVFHHLPSGMRADVIGEMVRVLRPDGRLVLVDLERPLTAYAAISLITLFHRVSRVTMPDWHEIEQILNQRGFAYIDRRTLGKALGVIVARRG